MKTFKICVAVISPDHKVLDYHVLASTDSYPVACCEIDEMKDKFVREESNVERFATQPWWKRWLRDWVTS